LIGSLQMGPRPDGRGKERAGAPARDRREGFNGAAT